MTMTTDRRSLDDVIMALEDLDLDLSFLVQTGSRAYGTAMPDSDIDLVGFYVENEYETYGLRHAPKLKYRYRQGEFPRNEDGSLRDSVRHFFVDDATGEELSYLQKLGVNDHDEKAHPSDIEILLLPLREFVSLAAAGNPEFVTPLFTPENSDLVVYLDRRAAYLVPRLRDAVITKHAAHRIAGYARTQRGVVMGTGKRRTNRPDLVARDGYDSKAGSHLLRLLLVGCRLAHEHMIYLPMPSDDVARVMQVRAGNVPLGDLIDECDHLADELESLTEQSDLPDDVDMAVVNQLLVDVRR